MKSSEMGDLDRRIARLQQFIHYTWKELEKETDLLSSLEILEVIFETEFQLNLLYHETLKIRQEILK